MASSYPTGLDSFPITHPSDDLVAGAIHDNADAVNKIEAELGITPKGSSATVAARLGTLLPLTGGTLTGTLDCAGGLTLGANVTIGDAKNIILNATTGTKIGTATTQKLGFFNATPVVQPSGTPAAATDLTTVISLANSLRTNLLALGLVA